MASQASESTRQKAMDVNRSLRTIKTELERLLELGAISDDGFNSLHDLLPQEWSLRSGAPASSTSSTPSTTAASTPLPQQQHQHQQQPPPLPFRSTPGPAAVAVAAAPPQEEAQPPQQPPRPAAAAGGRAVVGRAAAKYAYDAPNDGDLAFARGDPLAVFSQVNADWWLGRNEASGRVGLFPRQYVRPEPALAALERAGRVPLASEQEDAAAPADVVEDAGPAPPAYQRGGDDYYGEPKGAYGQAQQQQQQQQMYGQPQYPPYAQQQQQQPPYGQPPYGQPAYGQPAYGAPPPQGPPPAGPGDGAAKNGMGRKIGGKLGNAFITGVGFAAGAEVVGAIL